MSDALTVLRTGTQLIDSQPAPLVEQLPEALVRVELEELARSAVDLKKFALAESTRKNYQGAWSRFELWCLRRRLVPLPADTNTVRVFIQAAVERGIESTKGKAGRPCGLQAVDTYLSAIIAVHDLTGHPNPVTGISRLEREALRRKYGKPPKKKSGILIDDLRTMVRQIQPKDDSIAAKRRALRDRAILLVAFTSGGRRRSEVSSMQFENLKLRKDGSWEWVLPRHKGDQFGEGSLLHIPISSENGDNSTCPATALHAWLLESNIRSGPVFRGVLRSGRIGTKPFTPRLVAVLVKEIAAKAGLNPDDYAGHSLRRGFITDMARHGVATEAIMRRSLHKTHSVVQGYIEDAELGGENDPVLAAMRRK